MPATAKKKVLFSEQLKKAWRGFQRQMAGESTRVVQLTTIETKGPLANTNTTIETTQIRPLSFEKTHAVLQGPDREVRALRRLDSMIGKLAKPFNGASRVPDEVTARIDSHVSDLESAFEKVSAISSDGRKTPLRYLEYTNVYGDGVEQRLAKIRLG